MCKPKTMGVLYAVLYGYPPFPLYRCPVSKRLIVIHPVPTLKSDTGSRVHNRSLKNKSRVDMKRSHEFDIV